MSSSYKKFIEDKCLADETYTQDCVALIRISGTAIHNSLAVQVDAVSFFPQFCSSLIPFHPNLFDCEVSHTSGSKHRGLSSLTLMGICFITWLTAFSLANSLFPKDLENYLLS